VRNEYKPRRGDGEREPQACLAMYACALCVALRGFLCVLTVFPQLPLWATVCRAYGTPGSRKLENHRASLQGDGSNPGHTVCGKFKTPSFRGTLRAQESLFLGFKPRRDSSLRSE
jgi:hypothetical protein